MSADFTSAAPSPEDAGGGGELWSLREDVHVLATRAALVLRSRWGSVRLSQPSPVLREALRRMELGPARLENVPGTSELAQRVALLVDLRRLGGLVVRSVGAADGGSPLLSVVPTAADATLNPTVVPAGVPLRLSRFAMLRQAGGGSVLESPLSSFRVVLDRPEAGWLVTTLAGATTAEAALARLPFTGGTGQALLSHLVATGMVLTAERAADGVRFAEDTDPVLRAWSPHDLMFHWSSRPGRHDGAFGATYPLRGVQERPPDLKPVPDGPRIPLTRPEADTELCGKASLSRVVEERSSVRSFGSLPMTVDQLGEFLFRSMRVREREGRATSEGIGLATDRPYPNGGACYELECYLVVARCEGLEPGVYYYAPAEHCLVRLPAEERAAAGVLAEAQAGAGMTLTPDVLLTLTARFARVSWKYSGLAYALTLKHVGVVQQTLYLMATAMGLAGCAIGTGDTDQSARAFRLDWREESAVGEFVLGSRVETGAAAPAR